MRRAKKQRNERLVQFKAVYGASIRAVDRVIERLCPAVSETDRQSFLYMFFPFIYGIYPYTAVSEEHREAMETAEIGFPIMRSLIRLYKNCWAPSEV